MSARPRRASSMSFDTFFCLLFALLGAGGGAESNGYASSR
jgi:hypothetical protein